MNEVTLAKCKFCGHYYKADKKHKCKQSERFSYNQGKIDGFSEAYERMNKFLEKMLKEKEQKNE